MSQSNHRARDRPAARFSAKPTRNATGTLVETVRGRQTGQNCTGKSDPCASGQWGGRFYLLRQMMKLLKEHDYDLCDSDSQQPTSQPTQPASQTDDSARLNFLKFGKDDGDFRMETKKQWGRGRSISCTL